MDIGDGPLRGRSSFKFHYFTHEYSEPQKDTSGNEIDCSGTTLYNNIKKTVEFQKEATIAKNWLKTINVQVEAIPQVCEDGKIKHSHLHYVWLTTSTFNCSDEGLTIFKWKKPIFNIRDTKTNSWHATHPDSGKNAKIELQKMFGNTLPTTPWPSGMTLEMLANKVKQIKYK